MSKQSKEDIPKGDLISREDLKEEIVKLCERINANDGITVPTLAFTRIIDNAPTVEPEKAKEGEIVKAYTKGFDDGIEIARQKGEWICKDKVDGHMFGYSCSNCRNPEWQITRFCPNCGALMKGGAEDSGK